MLTNVQITFPLFVVQAEEEELCCAGGCALEQVAQSGCGISPTGGVLGLSGCNPVQ